MGSRLARFDYSTPYFYMVTIKAVKGAMPFASIRREPLPEDAAHRHGRSGAPASPACYLAANAITHALEGPMKAETAALAARRWEIS